MNLEGEKIKKFNSKKKRGPYKQYNVLGSNKVIPRRTLYDWNKKKKDVISRALVSSFHGDDFQGLVKIISNDEPCSPQSTMNSDAVLHQAGIHIEKEKVNEVIFDDIHPLEVEGLLTMRDRKTTKDYDINISQEFLIHNLVAMCIKWRRKTTYTIALDILKAMNSTTDNCCAPGESIYYFKKIVDRYSNPITSHYVCIKCGNYLGSIHDKLQCHKCSWKIDENSKKSHFLYLSLEDQLVEIFETTDAHNLYSQNREKLFPCAIEDIYDGKMYKKMHASNTDMITINFSIDGLPIFASSNTSVYPVLCTVNEFDPVERRKRILLSSIWFGKGKPQDMNEYLKPFVSEANKLYEQGFRYNFQGHQYSKKVLILMGICDAVARPIVRCSTQFNGRYGCGLCLHPGQEIAKGDGHARVYPLVGGGAFGEGLRNHQETLNQAKKHKKEDKKGIKRVSILTELHDFDIINCLDVDWMHCVALGVTRQFVNLWFDTANSSKDFYLRRNIADMDAKFLSFQSTSEFSRTPRSLNDRAHFKAHEWVAFLLAYSLPLLISYLPKRYLKHWALLVDAISILVKNSIFKSEIVYAHECLLDFVAGVEILYGVEQVTFNVHQLTHLSKSVENWGPLWTHSAFISEDYYQTLKAHVKSANGVVGQISDAFKLRCAIDRLAVKCKNDLNDKQKEIIHDLLHGELKAQSHSYIDDVHILGNSIIVTTLSTRQCLALRRCDSKFDRNSTFLFHKRCIINNQVVTSKSYNREQKRANFNVLLNDDQIFEIHYYIGARTDTRESNYAIGFYYELKDKPLIKNKRLNHLILLEKKIKYLEAIETKNIVKKVMIFELKELANYVAYVHGCGSELLI